MPPCAQSEDWSARSGQHIRLKITVFKGAWHYWSSGAQAALLRPQGDLAIDFTYRR